MLRSVAGSGTAATALLTKQGIPHTVHTYVHDPRHGSYGAEASAALGIEPGRVLKTLVADVDGKLAVGVVPVAAQLDLKALAAAVGGKKAALADVAAAERATGYVAGGISPVGQRKRLPVVIDSAAMEYPTRVLQRRPPRPGDRDSPRRPRPGRGRHRGAHRPAGLLAQHPAAEEVDGGGGEDRGQGDRPHHDG